ncbi:hypothetical protein ACF0H5_011066 [Mactra antiquata]
MITDIHKRFEDPSIALMMTMDINLKNKQNACYTNTKRTFILTLGLVLLTLTVMYGTTEHFSVTATSVFQAGRLPAIFTVNVSRTFNQIINSSNSEIYNLTKIVAAKSKELANKTFNIIQGDSRNNKNVTIVKAEPVPIKTDNISISAKVKTDKIVEHVDTIVDTINVMHVAKQNDEQDPVLTNKEVKTEPKMVTNKEVKTEPKMVTNKEVKTEPKMVTNKAISLEFPGMPDPCAKPRRNTGVQDILCMEPPKFLPDYKNPCWMDHGVLRCLPYFHLIGICKSGTSDFFKRLLLHPDIIPNKGIFGKEIWFWSWKRFAIKDRGGRFKYGMTLNEFTNQFKVDILRTSVDQNGYHDKITGHGDPMDVWDRFREEATPQNTPGAEELLWTTPYAVRHINPNVKLLLMLRNPVDRLYSHYFHGGYGTSSQSFHDHVVQSIAQWKTCTSKHSVRHCIYSPQEKQAMKAPIYTSFYIVHLKEWLKAFPREQIFIFRNEDYSKDIKGTMKQILNHLNVSIPSDEILNSMEALPHFYETKKKARAGPMKAATKELLLDLYGSYTEELARFLNDERFAFKD